MNIKHLKSVCVGPFAKTAEYEGKKLFTNGHIAFVCPEEFATGEAKPLAELEKSWAGWQATACAPVEAGECFCFGEDFSELRRKIGQRYVAERYYRCFCGEGVTWTATGDTDQSPLLVHRDGILVAVVMPARPGDFEARTVTPSDVEVFSPHATAGNHWYLADVQTLRNKLGRARRELIEEEERREEAEENIEALEAEISALESVCRERAAAA